MRKYLALIAIALTVGPKSWPMVTVLWSCRVVA